MHIIKIKVHSISQVITNSSTVIYTRAAAGATDTVKSIINDILVATGATERFDDLFAIAEAPSPEQLLDRDVLPEWAATIADDPSLDWADKKAKMQDAINNMILAGRSDEIPLPDDDEPAHTHLVIMPKRDELPDDIGARLRGLFDSEGMSDNW